MGIYDHSFDYNADFLKAIRHNMHMIVFFTIDTYLGIQNCMPLEF